MFHGPLFVVGCARSGTKLVRDLLNRHPKVGIPLWETEFLPRMAARKGDLSDPAEFGRFSAWIRRFFYFRYAREAGRDLTASEWRAACRGFRVPDVFEALCRHDGGAPEDGIWGDKSPNYRNHVPLLRQLYPQACVLHCIRDVRDVALSSQKAWGKDILRNAQRWVDEVAACRAEGAKLGTDYRELRYEDLVADPARVMRQTAGWLGIDFVPAMCSPGRVTENLGDARGATEVVADNTGKWKDRMDPSTLRRVESVAGPLMVSLAYPLALPPQPPRRIPAPEMLARQVRDGVSLIRFRVNEWGWKEALLATASALEAR